jgi:mitochondrial fission protein ELM1
VPPNVVLTDGSLHGVTAATLGAARREWASELGALRRPVLTLLVGGTVTRRWWQRPLVAQLSDAAAARLVRSACAAVDARGGGSVLVATSRRTPASARAAIDEALCEQRAAVPAVFTRAWAADASPNPYMGLLAWSDYLLVTAPGSHSAQTPHGDQCPAPSAH